VTTESPLSWHKAASPGEQIGPEIQGPADPMDWGSSRRGPAGSCFGPNVDQDVRSIGTYRNRVGAPVPEPRFRGSSADPKPPIYQDFRLRASDGNRTRVLSLGSRFGHFRRPAPIRQKVT
jgi:hypothetical protein